MPRSLFLLLAVCACLAANETYKAPSVVGFSYLLETFSDGLPQSWIPSVDPKYTGGWRTDVSTTEFVGILGDFGLLLVDKARHHGITSKFAKPVSLKEKDLVLQYEVKLQKGLECGGAYLKLLRERSDGDYSQLTGESPYVIMFGPDKCGESSKVHFIFNHKSPKTGKYGEKHMSSPPAIKTDALTHLYTLHVSPNNNSFAVYIDQVEAKSGSLSDSFTPPVNPPKEIDDPTDSKPSSWVDEEMIPDPEARKPEDWDEEAPSQIVDPKATKPTDWLDNEPAEVADPSAAKPANWNDEDDGEWEAPVIPNPRCELQGCGEWKAPLISNPAFKGKWSAPMIKNPEYKGPWKARQIPNPDYFEDPEPARSLDKMGALALELWTMTEEILFDNFILTDKLETAWDFARNTWAVKYAAEKNMSDTAAAAERALTESKGPFATITDFVTNTFNTAKRIATEQPMLFFGAVGLGLLPLAWFVWMNGGTVASDEQLSATQAPEPEGESTSVEPLLKPDTAASTTTEAASPSASQKGAKQRKNVKKE